MILAFFSNFANFAVYTNFEKLLYISIRKVWVNELKTQGISLSIVGMLTILSYYHTIYTIFPCRAPPIIHHIFPILVSS